jgi:hypothetical protein
VVWLSVLTLSLDKPLNLKPQFVIASQLKHLPSVSNFYYQDKASCKWLRVGGTALNTYDLCLQLQSDTLVYSSIAKFQGWFGSLF